VPDLVLVLLVILILVVIWRGPKTLPQIGAMLGRGVKAAREEADQIRTDRADRAGKGDGDTPPSA
jgi:Sec-independent protein translocase protein TatA